MNGKNNIGRLLTIMRLERPKPMVRILPFDWLQIKAEKTHTERETNEHDSICAQFEAAQLQQYEPILISQATTSCRLQ